MQDTIENKLSHIQNLFQNDTRFWITVFDEDRNGCHIDTVKQQDLATGYGGSMSRYLDSLKSQGYKNIKIRHRKAVGTTSSRAYPGTNDLIIELTHLPINTLPASNVQLAPNPTILPPEKPFVSPGHSGVGLNGVDVGKNMAMAMIYKEQLDQALKNRDALNSKLDTVTKERDQLKLDKIQITTEKIGLEKKLKRIKRKAKQPRGLAGLMNPDQTTALIHSLPEIINSVKGLGKSQDTTVLATQGQEPPSAVHIRVYELLNTWSPELLAELEIVIMKYQTGDDPEFIENLRKMIDIRSLQPKEAINA